MDDANIDNHSWLYDNMDGLKEKIVYRGRIEYRISGDLHNHFGPAIIYKYDDLYKTDITENESESFY